MRVWYTCISSLTPTASVWSSLQTWSLPSPPWRTSRNSWGSRTWATRWEMTPCDAVARDKMLTHHFCLPLYPSLHPPADHRGLAVHRPSGGPSLPLVVCHYYHPGHPGHLLRCQFQLHTWQPLSMKAKTHTYTHRCVCVCVSSRIFQQFHLKHTFHKDLKARSMYVVHSESF